VGEADAFRAADQEFQYQPYVRYLPDLSPLDAGAGSVVKVDYTEPDVLYNLATGGGNDPYDGLDQFDRVATAYWRYYGGTPADRVKINYTYDLVGSRISREDPIAKAQPTAVFQDEQYTYDGLDRLKRLDRGELLSGSITNKRFAQGVSVPSSTGVRGRDWIAVSIRALLVYGLIREMMQRS